jgi:oleandomycin transport system ATP-binding protein
VAAVLAEVGQSVPELTGRGRLSVPVAGEEALPVVVARLAAAGVGLIELSLHLPSLDEVFSTLTGHHTETDEDAA